MRLRRCRVFTTALMERKPVAVETFQVSFARPAAFTFHAGQYLQIRLPKLLHRDPKGPSRVFSIASSPLDDEMISVAYRDTGSGFKRTLRELPIGSEVTIEGPHGFYTLPRDASRPLILVAGGIGITPFRSMLQFAARSEGDSPSVTLLYANRSHERAAYLDELEDLARRNPRLTLHKRFGLIDEVLIRKSVTDLDTPLWFIAGPPTMVDTVRSTLDVLGVDTNNVHFEEFIGY